MVLSLRELLPANPLSPTALPVFNGDDDAYGWVLDIDQFLAETEISSSSKLLIAAFGLQGPPLQWWLQWSHHHPLASWESFIPPFLWHFKPEWQHLLPTPEPTLVEPSDLASDPSISSTPVDSDSDDFVSEDHGSSSSDFSSVLLAEMMFESDSADHTSSVSMDDVVSDSADFNSADITTIQMEQRLLSGEMIFLVEAAKMTSEVAVFEDSTILKQDEIHSFSVLRFYADPDPPPPTKPPDPIYCTASSLLPPAKLQDPNHHIENEQCELMIVWIPLLFLAISKEADTQGTESVFNGLKQDPLLKQMSQIQPNTDNRLASHICEVSLIINPSKFGVEGDEGLAGFQVGAEQVMILWPRISLLFAIPCDCWVSQYVKIQINGRTAHQVFDNMHKQIVRLSTSLLVGFIRVGLLDEKEFLSCEFVSIFGVMLIMEVIYGVFDLLRWRCGCDFAHCALYSKKRGTTNCLRFLLSQFGFILQDSWMDHHLSGSFSFSLVQRLVVKNEEAWSTLLDGCAKINSYIIDLFLFMHMVQLGYHNHNLVPSISNEVSSSLRFASLSSVVIPSLGWFSRKIQDQSSIVLVATRWITMNTAAIFFGTVLVVGYALYHKGAIIVQQNCKSYAVGAFLDQYAWMLQCQLPSNINITPHCVQIWKLDLIIWKHAQVTEDAKLVASNGIALTGCTKKWDPGEHSQMSKVLWSFQSKQWDPGKFICSQKKILQP